MPTFEQMAEQIVSAMRGYVSQATGALAKRLDAIEQKFGDRIEQVETMLLSQPPLKHGVDGKDGRDGVDGKDGRDGKDGEAGLAGVAGRDGVDGKDGAAGPPGEKGAMGAPGESGAQGPQGPQGESGGQGIAGKDGRDGIDGKDGAPGPQGEAGKDGAPGPQGEKGESGIAGKDGAPGRDGKDGGSGEKGIDGRDGRDGKDGKDGRDGKDGAAGRDALDIDILPALSVERSYPRGTFAQWAGGIVLATEDTRPIKDGGLFLAGWRVIVNGVSHISAEQEQERTIIVHCHLTDGTTTAAPFKLATTIYRGVWRDGSNYEAGDQVTKQGSQWTALRDTKSEPGNGATDWVLSVKKGSDGRDGKDGKPGQRGPEGKVGRDLTQLGFDGGKH